MADSSDISVSAPAGPPRPPRGLRLQPWRDFEAWLDAPGPLEPASELLRKAAGAMPDAASVARMNLMASAAGRTCTTHAEALRRLAHAAPVFAASGMQREAQAARCEAAGHLIELGCPHEARALLEGRPPEEAARPSKLGLAERAKLAMALMDLRLGPEAAGRVAELSRALHEAEDPQASRLLKRTLTLCMDVLLAADLASGRRLDTALAEGMPPGPARDTAAPGADLHSRVLARPLQALQRALPGDLEVLSLVLLQASVAGEAGTFERLQGLTQALSAHEERLPAAWLRLCVAYRLAGRTVLAAHCASEAVTAAFATGSLRLQRLALQESALMQSEAGQATALADTWRALRELDRAVWAARASFETLRELFQHEAGPAPVPAPGGGPVSARALHVETAIARLKADPGRPWKVDALAEATGVSRRTLELAFRLHGGLSVAEVIREHRIQRAQQLLRLTDHAIKRVAIEAGYSSASTLCRELRGHTGLSPRQIRLQHRRRG